MDVAAWVAQVACAVLYAASGAVKLVTTKEQMIERGITGVAPFPSPVIRVVAVAELLGAVGLVLPWSLGVAPVLTPLAAAGLAVIMAGAAAAHASLRERAPVLVVLVLALVLAGVTAVRLAGL